MGHRIKLGKLAKVTAVCYELEKYFEKKIKSVKNNIFYDTSVTLLR